MGSMLTAQLYRVGQRYFRRGMSPSMEPCVYAAILEEVMPRDARGFDCIVRTLGQLVPFRTDDLYERPSDIHL